MSRGMKARLHSNTMIGMKESGPSRNLLREKGNQNKEKRLLPWPAVLVEEEEPTSPRNLPPLQKGARACCEAWWAGSWAQSAHRFFAYECDRGLGRILNATDLRVAFALPLVGGLRLHGCRVSCGGQSADVGFGKCGTVEVFVIFLDTITPVFELYVRLRERRQHGPAAVWSTGVVLVGLHSCLTCSRGAAVGPFVLDCEAERLFLCCVVRVGYWPDQPVVRSCMVASFLFDSCFTTGVLWFGRAVLRGGRVMGPSTWGVSSFFSETFWGRGVSAEQSRGSSARPGGAAAGFFWTVQGSGVAWGVFSPRGRCAELGKRREFVFFEKCGTVEVCVVFLDTLTPVFELYVRLRERRQ
ncbi:hypothetical protein Taro_053442 [Colocasia esculenta]|uniref:Uncharacterized protein n=1 Tax=Colocasia esculenta TaxID=4460 RepID=A0A843XML0_COLES|nr:hypothetical protein [Colocasia esculenta]